MKQQPSHTADINRDCSRRRFLGAALAGAGTLAAGSQWLSSAPAMAAGGKGAACDVVTLGKTGIKASRLAQGTGWNGSGRSSAHTRLGEKEFDRLVRHGLERGITLMDMADLYGSHAYVRHALAGASRDNIVYLSKIWPRTEYWNSASGGAKAEVDRFRRELNTDVVDICLIHCMTNADWPQQHERIRDELDELKSKGAVRAVGVSCHDFGALKVAAAHPWVDVILARINNVGREAAMDASVEEVVPVLKQARANGKVILGMKIFGAGKLTSPAQKDASLKFVFENNLVDAVTIGMLSTEEVDDTITRMSRALIA
ncbi:aldo/keto reductase [Anaerobaca lacustris]|uniref:Aldo/keto reductase n=1 Tax=Anaerobaca lacustris TaxID=3044600 RepID=A0AAW6TVX0_9BACT|nr:aldo/keto reductase [Sedimentisphaerales bacterium M17dextr]